MSKMRIARNDTCKWVSFHELEIGDLFALSSTSDIFQRINLNSVEMGNCICLYTGELHYVIPTDSVLLVDAELTWRFQRVSDAE